MGQFMDPGCTAILKLLRTPIAQIGRILVHQFVLVILRLFNVRSDGIPRDVESQMSPQVLAIGETFEAGQAD